MSDPAPGFTRPPSPRELAREAIRSRPLRRTYGLIPAVRRAVRLGVTFRGRAARDEFWLVVLACTLVYAALIVLKALIFGPDYTLSIRGGVPVINREYNAGLPGTVFSLAVALPMLALGWRRLHYRNRAGFWVLVPPGLSILVPVAAALSVFGFQATWQALVGGRGLSASGPIWLSPAVLAVFASYILLIIQLARRGTPGPNRYGPDPLEVTK